MLPHPSGKPGDLGETIIRRLDRDMAEGVGEGDEIALRIDHHLLHEPGAAFEEAAQQVRLARTRIALDQEAGGEELLQVHRDRSEEHTSELQSLMRISYAVFCLKKKTPKYTR